MGNVEDAVNGVMHDVNVFDAGVAAAAATEELGAFL